LLIFHTYLSGKNIVPLKLTELLRLCYIYLSCCARAFTHFTWRAAIKLGCAMLSLLSLYVYQGRTRHGPIFTKMAR